MYTECVGYWEAISARGGWTSTLGGGGGGDGALWLDPSARNKMAQLTGLPKINRQKARSHGCPMGQKVVGGGAGGWNGRGTLTWGSGLGQTLTLTLVGDRVSDRWQASNHIPWGEAYTVSFQQNMMDTHAP